MQIYMDDVLNLCMFLSILCSISEENNLLIFFFFSKYFEVRRENVIQVQ